MLIPFSPGYPLLCKLVWPLVDGGGKSSQLCLILQHTIVFTEQGTSHIGADLCSIFKRTSFPSFSIKSMSQR